MLRSETTYWFTFIFSLLNSCFKRSTKATVNPVCTLESRAGAGGLGKCFLKKCGCSSPTLEGTELPEWLLCVDRAFIHFPVSKVYKLRNLPNLLGFLQNPSFQQEGARSNTFPRCLKTSSFPWRLTGPSANRQSKENQLSLGRTNNRQQKNRHFK